MTREQIILRLLAMEPAGRSDLVRDTGWGIEATNAVIDDLLRTGQVAPFPHDGNNAYRSRRLCLPAARAAALKTRKGTRRAA